MQVFPQVLGAVLANNQIRGGGPALMLTVGHPADIAKNCLIRKGEGRLVSEVLSVGGV